MNRDDAQDRHRAPTRTALVPEVYRLASYQYDLPPELIAQAPAADRDESLLMVVRKGPNRIEPRRFRDLPDLLREGDLLVVNETKVIPASLSGRKETGGRVDLLVLDPAEPPEGASSDDAARRVCLVNSSKPVRPGSIIRLIRGPELIAEGAPAAGRVRFRFPVSEKDLHGFLERYGKPPLPPYIKPSERDEARDRERYQTVYARVAGSVAAPTAGLHFTPEIMDRLEAEGIQSERIVLHVGPGTFAPVRDEDIRRHRMESEYYEISDETAERLATALDHGRRIIAVGTTCVRAMESAATDGGTIRAGRRRTDLFITPGYEFKVVRGLVTNFHLPGSTLFMLVCAFAGVGLTHAAYEDAKAGRFRFYSYGDACLVID